MAAAALHMAPRPTAASGPRLTAEDDDTAAAHAGGEVYGPPPPRVGAVASSRAQGTVPGPAPVRANTPVPANTVPTQAGPATAPAGADLPRAGDDAVPPPAVPHTVFLPPAPARARFGWLLASLGWTLRLAILLALVGGVAAVALWPVVEESRRIGVEIMPIQVPADLAARGLTPEVAAGRLIDALAAMATATRDNSRSRTTKDDFGPLPAFVVTPERLTMRKAASLLREFRGDAVRRISGEVVRQGDGRLGIRLRAPGAGSFAAAEGIAPDDTDALFAAVAPELWRRTVPLLYAWHVAETEAFEDQVRTKLVALAREMRLPPPVELRVSVLYARSLVRSGRAQEAIATLESLQRREPDYPLLWNVMAQAYADLGRADDALAAQRRAVEHEGTSVWSHISSAHLLMKLGKPREALNDLQSARRMSPNGFDAVVLESAALLSLGRPEDALRLIGRVVEARPDFPGVQEVLGNALLANKQPEEAMAAYEREIARNPANPSARIARANALRALRRPDEALAAVDDLLKASPRDGMAMVLRGWTLLDLGRADQALGVFDLLLKDKPNDVQPLYGRAMSLVVLGRRPEAIGALQRVIDLQPGNRRAAADLARLRGAARPPPPASLAPPPPGAPGPTPARP